MHRFDWHSHVELFYVIIGVGVLSMIVLLIYYGKIFWMDYPVKRVRKEDKRY